ncbi:OprD family porin [Pseudomonas synxantha]|uniref:OprD family porin n=1 Tax=Pseudomonas synxantha TaxID=47883 RepID=A0ABS0UPJ3_9PSED|nr:OprD family porin [Pseudomonas synxantha]MBI6566222.1 OprD family porin [Pseudomonas synxantha]MBI6584610.1 OprD family porin [Pseudomonas synxantha]MBI6646761.1 OprD family porin [Pseudomonas synxantha]
MPSKTFTSSALLSSTLLLSAHASAEFLKDSTANLELRNFYFNRDFRHSNAAQSKADEWAQGFLIRYESGFTDGTVGFGMDALGLLGVKLDSSPDRRGTGLLKSDRGTGPAEDEFGELGLTAKIRVSQSFFKVGTQQPKLPVVVANDTRLLPQTFRGAWLTSAELTKTKLELGRFDRVNQRNSSDNEEMTAFNGGARNISLGSTKITDRFNFAGATYQWSPALSNSYHYGELEGIYKQHYLALTHLLPITEGESLKSDIRLARSTADGGSNIDNTAFGAMFTYKLRAHAFALGYQRMSGDTGFANINGTDPYLVNLVQINDFGNEDERSWQARYDFDFAGRGIPGLTFMTRYISGDGIELGSGKPDGKEWERDTDLGYVIQSGPLKNVGIKWRNATARSSNFGSDIDENRLIVTYTLQLW